MNRFPCANPIFAVFVTLLFATGCSHVRTNASSSASPDDDGSRVSVTIDYVLRHSDRKITFEPASDTVHAESLMGGAKIKSAQIDAKHYREFAGKVAEFVQRHRSPASDRSTLPLTECRAPYKIIFKNRGDTTEVRGCRVSDEGAFSHLVQDGEFLIYRQK